jgi:hypothetical protein
VTSGRILQVRPCAIGHDRVVVHDDMDGILG